MKTFMTGAIAAFVPVFVASAAFAQCSPGVPCPATSTVPCGIRLVAGPIPSTTTLGQFQVFIRDGDGAFVTGAGRGVAVRFVNCYPDIQIAQGPSTDCATKTVASTSGTGTETMTIAGRSLAGTPTPSAPCAEVFAIPENILLGTMQVAVFDLDGFGGMSATDFAWWLDDFFFGPVPPNYRARSDYDFRLTCNPSIEAADLSDFLTYFFASGPTNSPPTCPP